MPALIGVFCGSSASGRCGRCRQRFCTAAGLASARVAYLPFGMGPRACPGAAFAAQESLLVIAQIVRRYRIEAVQGAGPVPVARLTLRALGGVRLRLGRVGG
jgi:cytochrome P450